MSRNRLSMVLAIALLVVSILISALLFAAMFFIGKRIELKQELWWVLTILILGG